MNGFAVGNDKQSIQIAAFRSSAKIDIRFCRRAPGVKPGTGECRHHPLELAANST
jgi:hypothetical protein